MDHDYSLQQGDMWIVPMSPQDSESYRLLRNRPENRCRFMYQGEISPDQQRRWYEDYLKGPDYMFSIYRDIPGGSMVYVGGLGLYDIAPDGKTAEFGRIIVDREAAGAGGWGLRATLALCEIAGRIGLSALKLEVKKDNPAAIKTYTSAGFQPTGEDDSCLFFIRNL